MNGNQNHQSLWTELQKTLPLAFPVVIGQLGHMMMGVVDSLMVGRLGAVPLAAASLANSLFFLILVIGLGLSYAITPFVSMAVGEGRPDKCGIVLRQGLLVCMIAGAVLVFITMGTAELIPFLNQPGAVVAQAVPYLKILGWSVLPVMVFQVFRQYTEGLSVMKPAMVINVLANVVNALFNWILIYGKFGAPAMGLSGAGIATFITRVIMAAALVVYVMYHARFKAFDPTLHFHSIDWHMMKRIVALGLASGFQYFFEIGAFAGAAVIIGWLGADALAAHQIALNLAAITYMFAFGISAAAAVRVGEATGARSRIRTRQSGLAAIILSASIMGFFAIGFVITRDLLPRFYISDPNVIRIAAALLIVAAMFQISDGIQAVSLGALRGMTDIRFPTAITLIAYWVVGLPLGYYLAFHQGLGVIGVWIGLFAALTASAGMLLTRFLHLTRQPVLS